MEAVELLESQHEQSQRSDIYQEAEHVPEPSVGRFPVLQNEEKENIVEDANSKATNGKQNMESISYDLRVYNKIKSTNIHVLFL